MIWMKVFLQGLKHVVNCDSHSAIELSKNATHHSWKMYIDVRYHWPQQVVAKELILLEKIHNEKNLADMMTKVMIREKFKIVIWTSIPWGKESQIYYNMR